MQRFKHRAFAKTASVQTMGRWKETIFANMAKRAGERNAGNVKRVKQPGPSPVWATRHTKLLVSLSDPDPDLPRPIGEAVLKAMAKDPSQRYEDVAQFLSALQTVSALPQPIVEPFSDASCFQHPCYDTTNPLENIESEVPLATRLSETAAITDFLERSEHEV